MIVEIDDRQLKTLNLKMGVSDKESKDIRKLVLDSQLEAGRESLGFKLASSTKVHRQAIIRANDSEDAEVAAAIEIQRYFRGYCTRCQLFNVVGPNVSKTALYGESKHHLARLQDVRTPSPKKGHTENKKQEYQEYVDRMLAEGLAPVSLDAFCIEEAKTSVNGKPFSKTRPSSEQESLASKPGKSKGRKKSDGPSTIDGAATIIQKAWRRHIDVQVYRYYKDLINFKQRGDPGLMLKCINPNEAKYVDAAMGIHIKFRLAGDKFPPNIYYKIFTHRPVQDLCANSPKDYTKATTKQHMAHDVHNKGNRVPHMAQKDGWYQRIENNGWRLVSDRLIHHIMSDPVTWETSYKKVDFHHNKLQRKQDLEKKKKQKKLDWMRKMYKEGMLQARTEDQETMELIEGAAAGMVATVEVQGPDAVQDWEVDELLDWTTGLNYDDYVRGWKEIATSGISEKSMEDRQNIYAQGMDPFELQISTGQRMTEGSTRPSHNTPVSI